ncbi:MAG: COX15/CtaA family protein, partial [Bacteroidota bacterium]
MIPKRPVVVWLVIGLIMVYCQIVIGGITRLTGSGLSITDWDIVFGTLPPLSDAAWMTEFELYKATPQYEKINQGMEMGSIFQAGTFKFIYFWEYFHRLWARGMGFVFLFPFLFFYAKKWLPKSLLRNLGIVVALAGLAACFGWIMVASGLIERPWVNAYKLAIHLSIGISVFTYLLWTYLNYAHQSRVTVLGPLRSPRWVYGLLGVICLQLFLGGIMSGMKAALIYPTWPDIGGEALPGVLLDRSQWTWTNFRDYDKGPFVFALMHFLHRGVAYALTGLIVWYGSRSGLFGRSKGHLSFKVFVVAVALQ